MFFFAEFCLLTENNLNAKKPLKDDIEKYSKILVDTKITQKLGNFKLRFGRNIKMNKNILKKSCSNHNLYIALRTKA